MSTATCPKCSAMNPEGARFCGACGANIAAAPPPPPPPPPPGGGGFAYTGPNSRYGMGGMAPSGGPPDAHTFAPMNAQATFDHIAQAVVRSGGHVIHGAPGQSLQIVTPYKSFWETSSMTVRYNGIVTLTPKSADETEVQARFMVDWGSTTGLFLMLAGCFIFMWFSTNMNLMTRNWGGLWALMGIVCLPYVAWSLMNATPKKVGQKFLRDLTGMGTPQPQSRAGGMGGDFLRTLQERAQSMRDGMQQPFAQQPAQSFGAQPAQPFGAQPAPGAGAQQSPMDQLERLAKLRDSGAITPAEFDAKKAELLARL